MDVSVVDASRIHIGPICADISEAERAMFVTIGWKPRAALRTMFNMSSYRRTGMLDGRPAAMWGVTGTLMAPTGEVWFALTERARAHRFLVARMAAQELRAMMATKTEIVSSIFCRDECGWRFAEFLGFTRAGDVSAFGTSFAVGALRVD